MKSFIFIVIFFTASVSANLNFFDGVGEFIEDKIIYPLLGINLSIPIETTAGVVQGKIESTVNKAVKYSSFLGIPFAQPPIGNLRFKPPREVNPWKVLYKATKQKNDCPQSSLITGVFNGKEDCLYLNVYTPKINSTDTKKRATMVWIYGGSFVSGTSNPKTYGPDFFIEEDVVVVAMNYRLGVLGFLSLNHTNASGNVGLKDQKMALEWVQQNIENFGGDPDKVTIFGQSAGSVATLFQVLSESPKKLFRSAIAMSGSPLNSWGFTPPAEAVSRAFAVGKILGVDTKDADYLLEKLHQFTAKKLVHALSKIPNPLLPYLTPTIEDPKVDSPFLTECSLNKLKTGKFNKVPIMLGFTSTETLPYVGFNKDTRSAILQGCLESVENITELQNTEQIKYLHEMQAKTKNKETFTEQDILKTSNITTGMAYHNGIDRIQQLLASQVPVYCYRNSFDYPQALHRLLGINMNGTGHADDVPQVFWASNRKQPRDPSSDIGIQRTKMVKMFTNFAKYGNPTPDGNSDPVLKMNWPASAPEGDCLEINTDFTIVNRPVDNFVKFLQNVIEPSLEQNHGCQ